LSVKIKIFGIFEAGLFIHEMHVLNYFDVGEQVSKLIMFRNNILKF
jgi:hypothetical protein